MKYFTREYWLALQSTGFTPPPPEHDPFARYRADLEALRGRVTPGVFQFFSGYSGFVTRFSVDSQFLSKYSLHQVGNAIHKEYWICARELDAFNQN